MTARLENALASARETRACVIGDGVLKDAPALFRDHFPGQKAAVVADPTTFRVAGRDVQEALAAAGLAGAAPFVFDDPSLYAEMTCVERLEAALRTHALIPVAVGSGTINDLTKLASFRCGRPYLCVATAASMDGYTAFGASITDRGSKQTFKCPAPRAVLADLDILCRAPADMTASGYADLMAKVASGADWLLADALGVEAVDAKAWEIVQGGLREALSDPAGARAGSVQTLEALTEGLMLSGLAMQWSRTSRPASGAEHQFSHLWDMEHHTHLGEAPSHGFKVGIATLFVLALYERVLATPLDRLNVAAACAQWPEAGEAEDEAQRLFAGTGFEEVGVTETRAKHVPRAALLKQLETLKTNWPEIRQCLSEQLLPHAEVKRRLAAVGAPVDPEAIGSTRARLRSSVLRAQKIRRRFTVLDLAVRTGCLDQWLQELFGPGGLWDENRPCPTR
ncbi:MAG: sn-glycerol-1-phosphate dehydrogenase [bacterium]